MADNKGSIVALKTSGVSLAGRALMWLLQRQHLRIFGRRRLTLNWIGSQLEHLTTKVEKRNRSQRIRTLQFFSNWMKRLL